MKVALYSKVGEKKSEVALPKVFDSTLRQDIAQKYFEVEKFVLRQRYANYDEAGRRHSASGIISHRRHKWKGAYGKGISRAPRKIMWRRGTQFNWVGAETSQARGGRSIGSPQGLYRARKINKKEQKIAMSTGYAATASKEEIQKRYTSLKSAPLVPVVIESMPAKTKEVIAVLDKIFGDSYDKLFQIKEVRAGKGKKRSRKYKSNAGLLIVVGKDEKVKFAGLEVKKVSEIKMRDLYPLGRLALYTEKSLEELKNVA
jgi:large subunit ribosomal protein L4e